MRRAPGPVTSDEFFARQHPLAHFDEPVIDLSFIDGMHLAEYALRDLMNVERFSRYDGDGPGRHASPLEPGGCARSSRSRSPAPQVGRDVYKVIDALRVHRPDVVCLEVDTEPTGTTVILLPDPAATGLVDNYDQLVQEQVTPDPQQVPSEILSRSRALDPEKLLENSLWASCVDCVTSMTTTPDLAHERPSTAQAWRPSEPDAACQPCQAGAIADARSSGRRRSTRSTVAAACRCTFPEVRRRSARGAGGGILVSGGGPASSDRGCLSLSRRRASILR